MGLLKLKPVNIRSRTVRECINPRLEKTETVMVECKKGLNPKIECQMRRRKGSFVENTCKRFNLTRKDSSSLKENRFVLGQRENSFALVDLEVGSEGRAALSNVLC